MFKRCCLFLVCTVLGSWDPPITTSGSYITQGSIPTPPSGSSTTGTSSTYQPHTHHGNSSMYQPHTHHGISSTCHPHTYHGNSSMYQPHTHHDNSSMYHPHTHHDNSSMYHSHTHHDNSSTYHPHTCSVFGVSACRNLGRSDRDRILLQIRLLRINEHVTFVHDSISYDDCVSSTRLD